MYDPTSYHGTFLARNVQIEFRIESRIESVAIIHKIYNLSASIPIATAMKEVICTNVCDFEKIARDDGPDLLEMLQDNNCYYF
jgi:hypothetical protein